MVLLDLDLYAFSSCSKNGGNTSLFSNQRYPGRIFTLLLRGGVSLAKARSACEFYVIVSRTNDNSQEVGLKETTKLILVGPKSAY